MLYLISSNALYKPDPGDSYKLFNIRYAQYVKGDADFRYYQVFDDNNTLVYRLMAGIGVPFGNIDVLPFIKSYYGGGANGIRAWSIYSLGPGSYQDSLDVRFDRYGDIKLEANLEYRFGVYKFWKAALFVDAGNVWFFKENPQFPGGGFNLNQFHKDIAIGAGLGMRLDFDFFILRVDAAFPVRNPAADKGLKWVNSFPGIRDWNINLGIGYPF
jgi:outer membrane protein assembly factor BamA